MRIKPNVLLIAIIAATGGLLFGFDTGVISGALPFLKDNWALNDRSIALLTTGVLFGAVIGALFSGRLADRLGRKKMIVVNALIFAVGAVGCGYATSIGTLIAMRVLVGIAIGITSYVVPMYIAEISPVAHRGMLVTLNQLMITIGLLASYIADYLLSNNADPGSWRVMFLVGTIPALVLLVGMFFLPETSRWLISVGRYKEGRKVLEQMEEPALVDSIFEEIRREVEGSGRPAGAPGDGRAWIVTRGVRDVGVRDVGVRDAGVRDVGVRDAVARDVGGRATGLREVLQPWLRPALIITVGIFFFQQFSGVNTIVYYSPIIFKMAGITGNSASILPAIVIGIVNVAACFISVLYLDKVGRRRLYLIGISGMIPSLVLAGVCFFFRDRLGSSLIYLSVGSIVCFIFFINISLSPLGWLLISEIYPTSARSVGMSIGSLSHWGFNAIIAFTFLRMVNGFGLAATFWVYAAVCVLGLVWGYYYIPETKGRSLEEIEAYWRAGGRPRGL
jgi:MFS transporter, SP family, galactose:H+ symporter